MLIKQILNGQLILELMWVHKNMFDKLNKFPCERKLWSWYIRSCMLFSCLMTSDLSKLFTYRIKPELLNMAWESLHMLSYFLPLISLNLALYPHENTCCSCTFWRHLFLHSWFISFLRPGLSSQESPFSTYLTKVLHIF